MGTLGMDQLKVRISLAALCNCDNLHHCILDEPGSSCHVSLAISILWPRKIILYPFHACKGLNLVSPNGLCKTDAHVHHLVVTLVYYVYLVTLYPLRYFVLVNISGIMHTQLHRGLLASISFRLQYLATPVTQYLQLTHYLCTDIHTTSVFSLKYPSSNDSSAIHFTGSVVCLSTL